MMLRPTSKPAQSAANKLLGCAAPLHKLVAFLRLPRGADARREKRKHAQRGQSASRRYPLSARLGALIISRPARRQAKNAYCCQHSLAVQPLEAREMLYGTIMAQNDPMSPGGYPALNTTAYTVAAPGVLANDSDTGGYQMTAHLESNPSHGTVILNGDGSFSYTATAGYEGTDSFTYYDTDTANNTSNVATVSLTVYPGALSDVDQTKLPADTLQVPMQILGSSSGQPATADNLSLVYHSNTALPTQILEHDWQPSMEPAQSLVLKVDATFNGTAQSSTYVSTSNLTGNNPVIRLSTDVNTASLPTGRYADSQSVSVIGTEREKGAGFEHRESAANRPSSSSMRRD